TGGARSAAPEQGAGLRNSAARSCGRALPLRLSAGLALAGDPDAAASNSGGSFEPRFPQGSSCSSPELGFCFDSPRLPRAFPDVIRRGGDVLVSQRRRRPSVGGGKDRVLEAGAVGNGKGKRIRKQRFSHFPPAGILTFVQGSASKLRLLSHSRLALPPPPPNPVSENVEGLEARDAGLPGPEGKGNSPGP
ncbi:unnamed protein product, partial [Gulo gulo]